MFPAMFSFARALPSRHPDIVLIRAAMAFDAVLEIADAFFDVLAPDLLGRVLMAAIAGIAAVVVAFVASHAFHVVIPVEHKIFVVIECRGYPFLLGMALAAIAGDLLME